MPAVDSIASLAAEYGAMSPRARRAVLKLLDRDERRALESYAAERADTRLSPWIAERCREAREGGGPLTQATRDALLSLEREPSPPPRPRGPSLAGRVGSLLGAAR